MNRRHPAAPVLDLLRESPGIVIAMIGMGLVGALLEGIGIGLFIPLLYSLQDGALDVDAGGMAGQAASTVYDLLPAEHRTLLLALGIFGIVVFKSAIAVAANILYSWNDARLFHRLRLRTVRAVLRAGPGFVERRKAGVLLHTMEGETWTAVEVVSTIVGFVVTLLTILVFGGLLLLISWPLTLAVFFVLAGISGVNWLLTRRVDDLSEQVTRIDEALSHRLLELLHGLRTVVVFGQRAAEEDRYGDETARLRRLYVRLDTAVGLIHPVSEVLVALLLLGVLWITGQGTIPLPVALTFLLILYRLHPHVTSLDSVRTSLAAARPSLRRVAALLDDAESFARTCHPRLAEATPDLPSGATSNGPPDDPDRVHLPALLRDPTPSISSPYRGDIVLREVTFRYAPADAPALDRVTACLPGGAVTAIVGPSGAGKSTLLDVVLGLYAAESGGITVGDVPISDLDHWRAHVAVVSQRVHLFHMSLADNIRYGSPQATDADVMQAARRAHIHDFIKALPHGYDTPAGDLGGLLSAGQRQRMALARAFVRQPDVFVFDEATSALDSLTDRAVRASLSAHLDGCTVLTVTHQLAQTRNADWIVVIQNGRIEASGTFADLILQDGLFSKMYVAQDGFANVTNTLTAATPSSDAEVLR